MDLYCAPMTWIILAVGCLVTSGTLAAESDKPSVKKETVATEESHRAIYLVRNTASANLVYLLEKHFEGTNGLRFLADPKLNLLSIRANSAATVEEVLKTLEQIDRLPRQIAVQLLIVEFPSKMGEDGNDNDKPTVRPDELTGSASDVLLKVQRWKRDGHVTSIRKFELKAYENNPSMLMIGEDRPVPNGVTISRPDGLATPTVAMNNFGTSVSVIARVADKDRIQMTVVAQDSQAQPPENGVVLGKGVNGPIVRPAVALKQLTTTIEVSDGGSNVATGFQSGLAQGQPPSYFVISARVVDSERLHRGGGAEGAAATPSTPADSAQPTVPAVPVVRESGPQDAAPSRFSRAVSSSLLRSFQVQDFARRLKLTEEQKSQFEQMRTEMVTEIRKRSEADAIPNITNEFDQKALKLLTDDQRKTWTEIQEESLTNPPAERSPDSGNDRNRGPSSRSESSFRSAPGRGNELSPQKRLADLNDQIPKRPGSALTLRRRADVFVELQQWDNAITDLRAIPRSTSVGGMKDRLNLALILAYRGDTIGSRDILRKMLESKESLYGDRLIIAALLYNEPAQQARLRALFDPHPPITLRPDFELGRVTELLNLGCNQGFGHMLHGQPLLAILCFETALTEVSNRKHGFRRSNALEKACLTLALLEIGDDSRATNLINEIEGELASSPMTIGEITDHVLLRHVRAQQTSVGTPKATIAK